MAQELTGQNVLDLPSIAGAHAEFLNHVIRGIIHQESGGKASARGKAGELGLMQLKPDIAKQYGFHPRQLFDPQTNIQIGTRYLSDLVRRYKGNWGKAIAAYNAGPGNVDKGRIPASTREYVKNVLHSMAATTPDDARGFDGVPLMRAQPNLKRVMPQNMAGWGSHIHQILNRHDEAGATEPGFPSDDQIMAKHYPTGTMETPAAASTPAAPWPVRAAEYLPMAGQAAGETGGAILGSSAGPLGAVGAAGFAGGMGDIAGEETRNLIRRHYGLPERSTSQVVNSGLWSALGSLFGVGGSKAAAPSALKAASGAKRGYEAAQSAVHDVSSEIETTLGIDRSTAQALARDPAARRGAREAFFKARQGGFNRLGTQYDALLKPYIGKLTPNSAGRQIRYEMSRSRDPRIFHLLERELQGRPPSPQVMQRFRSMVRQEMRHLNPQEDRDLLGALGRVETAATRDMKSVMSGSDGARFDALDRSYGDYTSQFPVTQIGRISRAPNSPEVIKEILKGKSSQIETLLNEMRQMPPSERFKYATNLRDAFGSFVHDEAVQAPDQYKGLVQLSKRLDTMPESMFNALYGGGGKQRILRLVNETAEMHKRLLTQPDLKQAIIHEMKAAPEPYLVHHAKWAAGVGLMHGLWRGNVEEAVGESLLFWGGLRGMHYVLNNPSMQGLYLRFVTSKTAPEIAAAMRALVIAAGTETGKSTFGADETGRNDADQ